MKAVSYGLMIVAAALALAASKESPGRLVASSESAKLVGGIDVSYGVCSLEYWPASPYVWCKPLCEGPPAAARPGFTVKPIDSYPCGLYSFCGNYAATGQSCF
jgi:hypothetical protein